MTQESSGQFSPGDAGQPEAVSRAEQEAIEWVVRMTSGEATQDDRAAFAQWRCRSPEHEAAAAMARKLWLGVGQALPARRKMRARQHWPLLALAASLLLVVGLGYRTFHAGPDAAAGGRSSVALNDSAHVQSDSGVQPGGGMTVEVGDAQGRCRLMLGRDEAYFDVTPNPDRPVAGEAGETQVRMLDTVFSVRPEASGVLVTVTGGRVEVNDGKVARVFTAGQQLRCRADRHQAFLQADPDPDRLTVYTALPGLDRTA